MRAMPPSMAKRNMVWYVLMSFATTGPGKHTHTHYYRMSISSHNLSNCMPGKIMQIRYEVCVFQQQG